MIIGIVGDVHAPFSHSMYKRFCQDVFEKWKVSHIHFTGDVVDAHALSFWMHDPNGKSANDEADAAYEEIQDWYQTFPAATVCIGNHDERHYRLARANGLPDRYLKGYREVWGTPNWNWDFQFQFDGVLYEHGTGTSGKDAALNRAMQKRKSCVMGHVHCYAGVKYHTNEDNTIFGMNAGCGIDTKLYAFEYSRSLAVKPVLGCGIVVDGNTGIFVPMQYMNGDKYHHSRARKRRRRTT